MGELTPTPIQSSSEKAIDEFNKVKQCILNASLEIEMARKALKNILKRYERLIQEETIGDDQK